MATDPSHIQVILFDLDGTLLDSRDFLVQSSFDILQKHYPNQFPYDRIEADFGNGFARLLPDQTSQISRKALKAFHNIKVEKYHETTYFPGVVDGLRYLHAQGFQLGVVTNQNKQVALYSLKYHQIASLFDVVIGLQDVQSGKPSAEGINKAIKQLRCQRHTVLMVGDSRFDVMAGQRAGVQTAFLKWHEKLLVPKESPPTYVFENFKLLTKALVKESNDM